MSRSLPFGRPLIGLASLALLGLATAMTTAAPVGAAGSATSDCPSGPPVLQLANPNPGDVLSQGDYIVSGVAFDPGSTTGNGISRVDLFLGQRDEGGLFLASATPNDQSGFTTKVGAFEVKTTLPTAMSGGRDFVAYAYSAASGAQTSVSVPVFIGAAPTPTPASSTTQAPVLFTSTTSSSCVGTGTASAPAASAASSTSAFQPLPAGAAPVAPVLSLGNPNAGDVLQTGDLIIEGVAYDPSAMEGVGVDRVDLFLDSRDSGGLPLGSAVPADNRTFHAKVTVPSTANGGHTFVAYAHSSVTGQETVVSVPIFVGVAPTPTPRPHS